ncbi:hypothetical protein ACM7OB_30130 [Pseudomonas aeruginosa]
MSKELNKALDLLREIRPSIPKDVLELWCKDRDAFLASHKAPVEQAGGDERAAFESRAEDAGSDISRDDFGNYVNVYVQTEWEGWQARAALAQPSPAQAEAEQHWPKLEKPAQVGGGRFSAGVSSRLVVEAAQRLYEFESTPEKEAERIERLQAFREQFDPLNLAPHAKAFNEAPAEALKPEQAEAERPEVVAVMESNGAGGKRLAQRFPIVNVFVGDELMTVAQHERIVGALRAVIAQLRQHKNDYMDSGQETYRALQNEIREREAEIARLDGLVSGRTAERDAALARVAELERQEPVALANRGLHAFWVKWTEAAAGLYGPGIKLYAAPVVQAQHSVPKEFIGRLSEFLAQRGATGKALLRELRALCAAAPGKEGL